MRKNRIRVLAGDKVLVDSGFGNVEAIVEGRVPLSIGGGIGQSRTYMALLKKAHLGEVSVTIWPKELRDICAERNIHVLQ